MGILVVLRESGGYVWRNTIHKTANWSWVNLQRQDACRLNSTSFPGSSLSKGPWERIWVSIVFVISVNDGYLYKHPFFVENLFSESRKGSAPLHLVIPRFVKSLQHYIFDSVSYFPIKWFSIDLHLETELCSPHHETNNISQ